MIVNDDCLEWMRTQPDNSIDCVVTDPPYGLKFMSKKWDYDIPSVELWTELLRVCKPGATMLCFGGSRTYHRLACRIEDAGWEIRDCIMWIYGSGFPKSHNHFGFEGYGTALKPAYEPIIMAMKPLDGTFKQNAEKWGVAGINIDASRIGTEEITTQANSGERQSFVKSFTGCDKSKHKGRWPANIILDEEAGALLDEQSGILKSPGSQTKRKNQSGLSWKNSCKEIIPANYLPPDSGGASRFFYCAKASTSERNAGLEGHEDKISPYSIAGREGTGLRLKGRVSSARKNNHPTVKPLKLMEYLIKLVMPPKDGILLDPFAGSGTTILAAQNLGFNAIGIEREKEYCDIAEARLKANLNNEQLKLAI